MIGSAKTGWEPKDAEERWDLMVERIFDAVHRRTPATAAMLPPAFTPATLEQDATLFGKPIVIVEPKMRDA